MAQELATTISTKYLCLFLQTPISLRAKIARLVCTGLITEVANYSYAVSGIVRLAEVKSRVEMESNHQLENIFTLRPIIEHFFGCQML